MHLGITLYTQFYKYTRYKWNIGFRMHMGNMYRWTNDNNSRHNYVLVNALTSILYVNYILLAVDAFFDESMCMTISEDVLLKCIYFLVYYTLQRRYRNIFDWFMFFHISLCQKSFVLFSHFIKRIHVHFSVDSLSLSHSIQTPCTFIEFRLERTCISKPT